MRVGFYYGDWIDLFGVLNSELFGILDESKVKILTSMDNVFVGLVFRFNRKIYAVRAISLKSDFAHIEQLKINTAPKKRRYAITCPFCGQEKEDSIAYDDVVNDEVCDRCRGVYAYKRHERITYDSSPVIPPEIKEVS